MNVISIVVLSLIGIIIITSTIPSSSVIHKNENTMEWIISLLLRRGDYHSNDCDGYCDNDNGSNALLLSFMKHPLTPSSQTTTENEMSISSPATTESDKESEKTAKIYIRKSASISDGHVTDPRRLKDTGNALSIRYSQGGSITSGTHNAIELMETIRHDVEKKEKLLSPLKAIAHLGPQKTGSSSLQAFLQRYLVNDLINDNYRLVPDVNYPRIGAAKSFTSCFKDPPQGNGTVSHSDGIDYSCYDATLQNTIQVATQYHSNLIYTAETIADFTFNVTSLYDFLLPYWKQIHIVGYYRRYYSWITSLHNEQNKHKNIPNRVPLANFVNNTKMMSSIYYGYYIIGTIHRFQKHPYNIDNQNANIHVYNLHNLLENEEHNNHQNVSGKHMDLLEHFYCIAIPDAKQACDKTKEILSSGDSMTSNEHRDLVYIELVYYARELGYIKTTTSNPNGYRLDDNKEDYRVLQSIAEKVRYHHTQVLKLDKNQFSPTITDALICPADDAYEHLLQLTLQAEKELFSSTYDETMIHNDYRSYRDSHKFCHIDAKKVLEENYYGWKDYFVNLEYK